MRLHDLLTALPPGADCAAGDVEIEGICADSRRLRPGDLFVAIPGVHVDGHRFIGDALNRGAAAVVGELPPDEVDHGLGSDFAYVRVTNSREAWGWACAAWHGFPSRRLTLIGVTGTDGKTTTVSLVHSILKAAGKRAGMITTVKAVIPSGEADVGAESSIAQCAERELETGLHTTTPDPPEIQHYLAQMADAGATYAVLEVTSHGLAQQRVAGCDFDVAVITNVTHEHLDFHGSLAAYREAKTKLFKSLSGSYRKPRVPKISVLNRDDDSFRYLAPLPADHRITYSLHQDADVTARDIAFESDWTHVCLRTPAGQAVIETPLVGEYNVQNVLAAASVGLGLGLSLEAVVEGIASLETVPGRLERIDEGQSFLAIVDFAHTPNALEQVLRTARNMTSDGGRVIVVFGSAGLRDREKRSLMGEIAGELADLVILTAEDPRTEDLETIMAPSAVAAQAQGKVEGIDLFQVPDRGEAILRACDIAGQNDVVIVCGKGHEQSMCFGTKEYPWDDREAVRRALHGEVLDTLPTGRRTSC